MLRILTAALLANAAIHPTNAAAQAAPAAASSHEALALELAQLGQPTALLVEGVLMGYDLASKEQKPDADAAQVEEEFPGFMAKVQQRGRAELERLMTERAPALHRQLADLYAANLTDPQMRDMMAFLRTPTGLKFVRSMMLSSSGANSAEDLTLTAEEVAAENRAAASETMKKLSGDEWLELMKFATSPAGQANRALAEKAQPLVATSMTAIMTEFTKRMEPITMDILESHIKAKAD